MFVRKKGSSPDMLHQVLPWLLVAAFSGAGVFNTIGTAATQADFVRWGYPAWWCRLTGLLEVLIAALVAFPATRSVGLIVGAVILAVAAATVCRHRDYGHLVPLGIFALLVASTFMLR